MSTKTEKQDKLITVEGKEKAIKNLFSSVFKYLAVGYNVATDGNGFVNVENSTADHGFNEITQDDDSTYHRVELNVQETPSIDWETGRVVVKFLAELDVDNIIDNNVPINQIAIFDTQEINSGTMYCAGTTNNFPKDEQLALVFVIEMSM